MYMEQQSDNSPERLSQATFSKRGVLQVVGPGLLYAASAVGVSHLVQSTRAGAHYGLGMGIIILLACLLKYPAIRFGGVYSAATGESLISSYRKLGWFAFLLYTATQFFSGFFILGAVSIFTAGLVEAAIGIQVSNVVAVSILYVLTLIILISGKYRVLEKLTKYIVAIFTLLIAVSTVMIIQKTDWSGHLFSLPSFDLATVPFILALMGFMPSPTDASMLQSLWTCARAKERGELPNQRDAGIDFNVGYILSLILALCFLVMGTCIFYTSDVKLVSSNFGFSKQIIGLFTQIMGSWSFPLIALAAITVMFSTTYTVLDGYIRVFSEILVNAAPQRSWVNDRTKLYNVIGVLLCVGAVLVIALMMKSLAMFMDLTSIIVFLTSPVFAILNHLSVFGRRMPEDQRPSGLMKLWSYLGIVALAAMTLIYIYIKFF